MKARKGAFDAHPGASEVHNRSEEANSGALESLLASGADSEHFDEGPDQDQRQIENSEPDPHRSGKTDPDPHQCDMDPQSWAPATAYFSVK